MLKIITELLNWPYAYFIWPLEYLIKKPLYPQSEWQSVYLRSNHVMHCYVCYWYIFIAVKNQFWGIHFQFWMPIIQTYSIYVNMVTFRSWKRSAQKSLGNTGRPLYDFLHFSVVIIPLQTYNCLLFCDDNDMLVYVVKKFYHSLAHFVDIWFNPHALRTGNKISYGGK